MNTTVTLTDHEIAVLMRALSNHRLQHQTFAARMVANKELAAQHRQEVSATSRLYNKLHKANDDNEVRA